VLTPPLSALYAIAALLAKRHILSFFAVLQKSFKMGRVSVKRGCFIGRDWQMSKFLPIFVKKLCLLPEYAFCAKV